MELYHDPHEHTQQKSLLIACIALSSEGIFLPLSSPPADELWNGYCEPRDASIFLILALSMLH